MKLISRDGIQYVIDTINRLGVALVDHNHKWVDEERESYERSITVLECELEHNS